jgi:predicted nucleotide-binding protein
VKADLPLSHAQSRSPCVPGFGVVRGAAPRDNVVFEAGYFVHAKGQRRVLIVLESGAKMPADLGGSIYAPLDDRSNIESLAGQLKRFLAEL